MYPSIHAVDGIEHIAQKNLQKEDTNMCSIKTQTYATFSSRNAYGYNDPTAAVLDRVAREQWAKLIADSKAKKPVKYRLAWKPQA